MLDEKTQTPFDCTMARGGWKHFQHIYRDRRWYLVGHQPIYFSVPCASAAFYASLRIIEYYQRIADPVDRPCVRDA